MRFNRILTGTLVLLSVTSETQVVGFCVNGGSPQKCYSLWIVRTARLFRQRTQICENRQKMTGTPAMAPSAAELPAAAFAALGHLSERAQRLERQFGAAFGHAARSFAESLAHGAV